MSNICNKILYSENRVLRVCIVILLTFCILFSSFSIVEKPVYAIAGVDDAIILTIIGILGASGVVFATSESARLTACNVWDSMTDSVKSAVQSIASSWEADKSKAVLLSSVVIDWFASFFGANYIEGSGIKVSNVYNLETNKVLSSFNYSDLNLYQSSAYRYTNFIRCGYPELVNNFKNYTLVISNIAVCASLYKSTDYGISFLAYTDDYYIDYTENSTPSGLKSDLGYSYYIIYTGISSFSKNVYSRSDNKTKIYLDDVSCYNFKIYSISSSSDFSFGNISNYKYYSTLSVPCSLTDFTTDIPYTTENVNTGSTYFPEEQHYNTVNSDDKKLTTEVPINIPKSLNDCVDMPVSDYRSTTSTDIPTDDVIDTSGNITSDGTGDGIFSNVGRWILNIPILGDILKLLGKILSAIGDLLKALLEAIAKGWTNFIEWASGLTLAGAITAILEGIQSIFVPKGFTWNDFVNKAMGIFGGTTIDFTDYVNSLSIPDVTVGGKLMGHNTSSVTIVDNSGLRKSIGTVRIWIGTFLCALGIIYNYNMFMKLMGYGSLSYGNHRTSRNSVGGKEE